MIPAFLRSRLKAGGIHLCVSGLIALLSMALIYRVWYPGALAQIQGVSELVLVLIGVDVVIGPLITTVVYNPAKKWLHFDLGTIAAVQTIALLYGLHTVFLGRPIYVVYNVDRFNVVQAQDVDQASLERAQQKGGKGPGWWGPLTVAARLPEDPKALRDLMFSSATGGADLPQLPEYFLPYRDDANAVLKRKRPMDELRRLNSLDEAAWHSLQASLARPWEDLAYIPLKGKVSEGAVVVDAKTAEVVRILTLTPMWGKAKPSGAEPTATTPSPANAPATPRSGPPAVREGGAGLG